MTNRLVIHLPDSTYTFESDNQTKLITLSDFCKKEFHAYHASEQINEITVDYFDEEMSNKFDSLIFELGLI